MGWPFSYGDYITNTISSVIIVVEDIIKLIK